jgi:predicted secreted protein
LRSAGSLSLYAALSAIGLFEGRPVSAQTFDATLFQAKTLSELIRMLGGASAATSKEILITAPDFAENGALVPEKFLKNHWARLPGGEPPPEFTRRLRELLGMG